MAPKTDVGAQRPRGHLCYLWGVLFPVEYLLLNRRDQQHPFLRFNCIQCLLLIALLIPLFYWSDKSASGIASLAFLIVLFAYFVAMIQAGRRKMCKLPVVGDIAERLTSTLKPPSE
jgi:uncharacterized membrane protein